MKVTIWGAGAWGTALGLVLSRNGHQVRVWGHRPEHLAELAGSRVNARFLPGIALPADWSFEVDFSSSLIGADVLVLAVPSKAFREAAARLAGFRGTVVSVTKGIEFTSGLTMTGILDSVAPGLRVAALSGPSLASEVARGIPTAVVAASRRANAQADRVVGYPSTAETEPARISVTDPPRPTFSPKPRLRLSLEKQVNTRSPSPLRPEKVSAKAPQATPIRIISVLPRVTNAALALSP